MYKGLRKYVFSYLDQFKKISICLYNVQMYTQCQSHLIYQLVNNETNKNNTNKMNYRSNTIKRGREFWVYLKLGRHRGNEQN